VTEPQIEAERLIRHHPLREQVRAYPVAITDAEVTIKGTSPLTGEPVVIVLHDVDPYRLETATVIPDGHRRTPDFEIQSPDEVETYHFILVGECRQEHSPALTFYTGDAYERETAQ
jgi:hypothetical protein